MKDDNVCEVRLTALGVPDVEFYRYEAECMRGEYVAGQFNRFVERLKRFASTKALLLMRSVRA